MAYSGNQALPGLWPVNNGNAGTSPKVREYAVSATYNTTIGEGCLVIKDNLGINLATGTIGAGMIVGVAAHNLKASSAAGTRAADKILVYDDPAQEFVCVADGTMTSTVAIEMVGQYVQVLSNVYSGTYTQGKVVIDISTLVATWSTTRPLQILELMPNVGEVRTSAYAQVKVKIGPAAHIYASQQGTNTFPT